MLINDISLELGHYKEDMARIVELTQKAAETRNLEGLRLIATNYPNIVAKTLNEMDIDNVTLDKISKEDLIQLYSLTKKQLSFKFRKEILDKIIPFITEKAKRIYLKGIASSVARFKNYEPGDQWDLEMTMQRMLSSGSGLPTYDNIVVREPEKRKRSIVICIDKSLSVLQHIHQIVLTASVLSLTVKRDNLAIIGFDSEAQLLKKMAETTHPNEIVRKILDLESRGKTNISEALELAHNELKQGSALERIIYLISDLERTAGKNPLPFIKRTKDFRVIYFRTYRRMPFVDEIAILSNVILRELNENTDLVELTTEMAS